MRELERILGLLEGGFQRLRVLIVGDVMLDRYIWGKVDRISPEAPVPVVNFTHRTQAPGGAANVAMNLIGLGVQVVLAGYWGNDLERNELSELLSAAGADCSGMITSGLPTTSKTRIFGGRQQFLRLDIEKPSLQPAAEQAALLDRVTELAKTADGIILSDYAKGAINAQLCRRLIDHGRKRGIPVLVDPKDRDFSKYDGATTICPNLMELAAATKLSHGETDRILEAGQRLVTRHSIDYMTVTMSEKGIRILRSDSVFHSPAQAREVFDVSGAGDTAIATMAACLAAGLPPEPAVELANMAAGIVVSKVGTAPITRHELIAKLTASAIKKAEEKLLDLDRLLVRVAEWRSAGQVIVFTNGCFDLLHVGHLILLEQCRRFGDKVIVGINSDASVTKLKGIGRPILGERERARVLGALAVTDAVVVFSEDTPIELIRSIRPDVLVKGGDYLESAVVGAEDVKSCGGRVEIVPTVEGFSTTSILQRMMGQSNR